MHNDMNADREGGMSRKGGRRREYSSSNIIDILEKKYCGGFGMLDPDFEDGDDGSGWEESPIPSTDGGVVGGGDSADAGQKKKKRRKRGDKEQQQQQGDYYDMDDSFIDDTDNITEIQSQISGKYLKTKHR